MQTRGVCVCVCHGHLGDNMTVAQSFTLKSSPNIDVSQLIRGLALRNPSQMETLYPKMHWIDEALGTVIV